MTTDTQIEAEIQAKGKTAPRVRLADLDANIASEWYFTGADGAAGAALSGTPYETQPPVPANHPLGLLTFCVLVLRNGFTVTGESACASPENFDAEIGRKIARENAVAKVWPLMGYALKTELSRPVLTEADSLADLAGTPRPDNPSISLPPHQQRVVLEKAELDERIHKLFAFQQTPTFEILHPAEQERLVSQLSAMRAYAEVLRQRIAAFAPAADFLANSKACDLSGETGCEACQ